MTLDLIYEDDDLEVKFNDLSSRDCFVTFTGIGNHQGSGFGQGFIAKNGYSGLFFISKWDHWYQTNSMIEAVSRSVSLLKARDFAEIIAYGASMGAYGAISNSAALMATRAVIMAPQFSIDGAKVPFERRWRMEASQLVFSRDDMADQISRTTKKAIFFDPVSVDRLHADLFAQFPNTELISVPMGGHIPSRLLNDVGMLQDVVIEFAQDRFDRATFFSRLRAGRRRSAAYWQAFAEAAATKRPKVALHVLTRGLQLIADDPAMLLHRANLLIRVRHFEDALAAAEHAVAVLPHHPAAWRALSTANRFLKRATDSVSAARKAVELRPKEADLWRVLLEALMLAQDYDEAVRVGLEAVNLAPNYAPGYLRTAQAMQEQGKLRAVDMLAKAVALAPKNEAWAKMLDDWRQDLADKPL